MISYRIEPIEGFDAIPMNTPPVYHATLYSLDANNLRLTGDGVAERIRPLDIDFQGIEAKINISYDGINHRD